MSHLVVFNSSAKSVKIPTNPTKYLTEVRDEACQKLSVNKEQFTLKYNNKPIALSQQIRLANLPQGARLELVQASRSPTVISVALQLPATNGTRLTQKFASNTSLWEILRQFESTQGANHNFTQRGVPEISANGTSGAGRLNYEMPVVTVMPGHREQSDFVGLQKTLSQLGFDSGSALLRLSFKNSGTPLEEAMTQISLYFRNSDNPLSGAHAVTANQSNSIPKPEAAALEAVEAAPNASTPSNTGAEPEQMDVDSDQWTESTAPIPTLVDSGVVSTENAAPSRSPGPSGAPVASTTITSQGRNIRIFAAPTSATPQAARRAFNEGDYEPTVEHAKSHQAALQARTRNQRLLSDKELEDVEAARQEKINAAAEKGSSVRVRMPDQSQIEMPISKDDTAESLYDFVESFLEFKEPFQLKHMGKNGRHILLARDEKRLIQDSGFSFAELVTFLWDDKASNEARLSRRTLAKEWQEKAQPLKVEEPVAEDKPDPTPAGGQSKAEGKRKAGTSAADKESKLKSILGKGLFKR